MPFVKTVSAPMHAKERKRKCLKIAPKGRQPISQATSEFNKNYAAQRPKTTATADQQPATRAS